MQKKEPEVVPEKFRCKRSDGKRWRCRARVMRGKTFCESHYFQNQRRHEKSASQKKRKRREEGGEALSKNRKNEVEKQQVSRQQFSTVPLPKKSKSKTQRQPELLNEEAEMDESINHIAEKEPDVQLHKVQTTPPSTQTAKDLACRPLLDCSSKSTGTLGEAESTMCQDRDEARLEEVGPSGPDFGKMGIRGGDDVFNILAAERDQLRTDLTALEKERQSWQDRAVQLEIQLVSVEAERVQWQVERAGWQAQMLQYESQLSSSQEDRDSVGHLQLAVDQLSEDIQREASRAAYYQSQLRRHAPTVRVQLFSEYKQ